MGTINQPLSVIVEAYLTPERDHIEFGITTEDGSPLTPQAIIDALGDYLLMDPYKLFQTQDGK